MESQIVVPFMTFAEFVVVMVPLAEIV
jgi:hypothetical protein